MVRYYSALDEWNNPSVILMANQSSKKMPLSNNLLNYFKDKISTKTHWDTGPSVFILG